MSKARDLANAGTALGAVTATELGYVDGVTSAIQTQIDSKIGQSTAINPTLVDAKGDIIAATAADTVARLAVGANDTVLTADSTTATGLKWVAPSAGANWSLLNAGGTSLSGTTTTVSGISGKDKILVLVEDCKANAATVQFNFRLNTDTGSNYTYFGSNINETSVVAVGDTSFISSTSINFARSANTAGDMVSGTLQITGANAAGVKAFTVIGAGRQSSGVNQYAVSAQGVYSGSSVISSVSVVANSGSFTGGKMYVYTSA